MLAIAALNASAANWTLIRRIGQFAGCAASMVDARSILQAGVAETNPILGSGPASALRGQPCENTTGRPWAVIAGPAFILRRTCVRSRSSDHDTSYARAARDRRPFAAARTR